MAETTSLGEALARIPVLKAGTPLRDALTSSYLNAIRSALIALARGDNLLGCMNILVRKFPLGYSLRGTATSAGGSSTVAFFTLLDASEGSTKKFRIVSGTLLGAVPDGFSAGDNPPYVITVTGSGWVYGVVTIDDATGAVSSRTLGNGESVPASSDTTFYFTIGSYSVSEGKLTVSNSLYGPIAKTVARDWSKGPGATGRWVLLD